MIEGLIDAPIFSVAIVSPHRDDAAFSCGILMSVCLRRSIEVTIFNIFTISDYAPYAPDASVVEVSRLRRCEDDEVLRRLGRGVRMQDLAQLDAPLRLGISEHEVLTNPLSRERFDDEVRRLAPLLKNLEDFDLVLLPSSIGGHIDHSIAREAARLSAPAARTAFYEDLPYASWAGGSRRQDFQSHVADFTGYSLVTICLRTAQGGALKRELASIYSSQISRDVAVGIGAYADELDGGERLYAPGTLVMQLRDALEGSTVEASAGALEIVS